MENFNWCGYSWKSSMEGDRLIHPKEPWMWIDKSQVKILKDNTLQLTLAYNPTNITYDGKEYSPKIGCGLIRSIEEFGYGTFSAEIKLPRGCNLWPSFWITGSENWPPEIDIMEAWANEDYSYFRWFTPQFPWINPGWRTTTNVHYNDKNLKEKQTGSKNISWFKQRKNPETEFIKYSCVWKENSITFYVNDKQTRKITGKICKYLTTNLKHPNKTWKMNVVFNVFCEDNTSNLIDIGNPMLIKNFKYEV